MKTDGSEAGVSAIRALLKTEPALNSKIRGLADELRRDERWEEADAIYSILIEQTGNDKDTWRLFHSRGITRKQRNLWLEAENDLLIALSLAPTNPLIQNSLGYSWLERDQHLPLALTLLKQAVSTSPDDPFIRDSLGWAHVKLGNLNEGLHHIKQATTQKPEEAEILAHLADTYRQLGRTEEAKTTFARALSHAHTPDVIAFINRLQELLGVVVPLSMNAEEASVQIVKRLASTNPVRRRQVSIDPTGVAIRGYDPVAYFTQNKPVLGDIRYFTIWHEAVWLFSTAKSRDMFAATPERYAPAFGGHCAYCVAVGHKLHGDPAAWVVHKDRLYLHQTVDLRTEWEKTPDQDLRVRAKNSILGQCLPRSSTSST